MKVYLDNAATTPLSERTKEYICSILDLYGNPSSAHSIGKEMAVMIDEARKTVAEFINAEPENIYFTSGGCASNTLAIKGYYNATYNSILYSPIAHKSITKCAKSITNSHPLVVDEKGRLDVGEMRAQIAWSISNHPLVTVDYANSEIGTIQDAEKIIWSSHLVSAPVYLDCTGYIPYKKIDVKKLDVDMIGFSAHKLGGLKGCGVLYKKPETMMSPIIYGSQESGFFGGTENTLGILTLADVIRNYQYKDASHPRDELCNFILSEIPDTYVVGGLTNRLPNNLFVCFKGVSGEKIMGILDANEIYVSNGSACNSGSPEPSEALTAIGMNEPDIYSCVRFTFSGDETEEQIDYVCHKLKSTVEMLRCFNG